MAGYHFPELNVNQILVSLSELCSLQVDEVAFKKPDPILWQEVFRRMLCEIKGMQEDTFIQPLILLETEYPDLHINSVPLMNIIIMMQKIMPILGIPDFSGGDIISPNVHRLKKICSAVINFLRAEMPVLGSQLFPDRKEPGTDPKQMGLLRVQEKDDYDVLLKRREELRQRIEKIKKDRAKQEPELCKVQEDIDETSLKLAEQQKSKQAQQKTIADLKTKITEKVAAADHLKCSILKAKEEGEKLSSKIVHSPEKVQAEQDNLRHQLMALKDGMERKRSRLGQLQKMRENYKQYTINADKALKLFESIKANIDKENEIVESMIQQQDTIQEHEQQIQDLYNKKTHLQSRLSMRQEKLTKLNLQHQSRMKVLQEQYECLKEEKNMILEKQSSDSERRLELVEMKKRKEEETKKEQELVEERIKVLMEMYGILIEKTDASHTDIGQNWDQIRQLLKQGV